MIHKAVIVVLTSGALRRPAPLRYYFCVELS